MAWPMPRLPPVTKAVLPAMEKITILLKHRCGHEESLVNLRFYDVSKLRHQLRSILNQGASLSLECVSSTALGFGMRGAQMLVSALTWIR